MIRVLTRAGGTPIYVQRRYVELLLYAYLHFAGTKSPFQTFGIQNRICVSLTCLDMKHDCLRD
jgi:hypothetical protein